MKVVTIKYKVPFKLDRSAQPFESYRVMQNSVTDGKKWQT